MTHATISLRTGVRVIVEEGDQSQPEDRLARERLLAPAGVSIIGRIGQPGGPAYGGSAGSGLHTAFELLRRQLNGVSAIVDGAFVGRHSPSYGGNVYIENRTRSRSIIGQHLVDPECDEGNPVPAAVQFRQSIHGTGRSVELNRPAFVAERSLYGDVETNTTLFALRKRAGENAEDTGPWIGDDRGETWFVMDGGTYFSRGGLFLMGDDANAILRGGSAFVEYGGVVAVLGPGVSSDDASGTSLAMARLSGSDGILGDIYGNSIVLSLTGSTSKFDAYGLDCSMLEIDGQSARPAQFGASNWGLWVDSDTDELKFWDGATDTVLGAAGSGTGGWDDNSGTVELTDPTDGVGIGAAPGADAKLEITGDATRPSFRFTGGSGADPGAFTVECGDGDSGGGGIFLTAGDASAASGQEGGSVEFVAGAGDGAGAPGTFVFLDGAGVVFRAGPGNPEGAFVGAPGSLFLSRDGPLYRKEAGTGTDDTGWVEVGGTDHGALDGLTDDDHTQYVLLAGRTGSGGQEVFGGTAAGDVLTLRGTSDDTGPTAGYVRVLFHDDGTSNVAEALRLQHSTSSGSEANGFGVRLGVRLQDSAGNADEAGSLDWLWTDVTSGSEDADILLRLRRGGTAAVKGRLTSQGTLELPRDTTARDAAQSQFGGLFFRDTPFRLYANNASGVEREVGDHRVVDVQTGTTAQSMSVTIPANTLAIDEEALEIEASGVMDDTETLIVTYGGSTIGSFSVPDLNGGAWYLRGIMVRTGASSQVFSGVMSFGVTPFNAVVSGTAAAVSHASDQTLAVNTQGEAAEDIVRFMHVRKLGSDA